MLSAIFALALTSGPTTFDPQEPRENTDAEKQRIMRYGHTDIEPYPGAKRILILGDSITAAGLYTAYLEGYFAVRYPDRPIEIINLGLPSETVSGLSEPSHPWPRPNVHERLDRALTMLKPDVVIACYGMNDGIYAPFSEERFAKYQAGLNALVERCRKDKILVALITPPPFDPVPVKAKLKEAAADDYGWKTPYVRYQEDVLSHYGAWVVGRTEKGVTTIDVQGAILNFVNGERKGNKHPDYRQADDGVHMNADGHWIIASMILHSWTNGPRNDIASVDARTSRAVIGDVTKIRTEAGGVRFSWTTKVPIPRDPDWSDAIRNDREWFGCSHNLEITGLRNGRYALHEGIRSLGSVKIEDGDTYIDLRKFPELSTNRRADELGELIRKRERIMSPAWRDYVGHKRPDTAKGLPLEEAKKQAEPITAEIRRLSRPVALELSLRAN